MVNFYQRLICFIGFCFLCSTIGLGHMLYHKSQKVENLSERVENLERTNHVISSKLESTQDSLNAATSRDILWLSRVLYSETDKPLEMYYIAHVVKNRVETCYRGECSYKEVTLDPYEFSAFNPNRSSRYYLIHLDDSNVRDPGRWAAAKQIALNTYLDDHDPTNGGTHFFAQVSMRNHEFPDWAYHGDQVALANNVQEERLRVYKNVR